MKFLYELLTNKKFQNPKEQDPDELNDTGGAPTDDLEDDPEEELVFPGDEEEPTDEDELGEEDPEQDQDGLDDDDKKDVTDVVNKATENPDRQGAIRTVSGSHLVYKRQIKDGTFEELWMYKNEDMKKALNTRRDIISGTDIPINKSASEDNKQSYNIWTVGNVEMLNISGLPN